MCVCVCNAFSSSVLGFFIQFVKKKSIVNSVIFLWKKITQHTLWKCSLDEIYSFWLIIIRNSNTFFFISLLFILISKTSKGRTHNWKMLGEIRLILSHATATELCNVCTLSFPYFPASSSPKIISTTYSIRIQSIRAFILVRFMNIYIYIFFLISLFY